MQHNKGLIFIKNFLKGSQRISNKYIILLEYKVINIIHIMLRFTYKLLSSSNNIRLHNSDSYKIKIHIKFQFICQEIVIYKVINIIHIMLRFTYKLLSSSNNTRLHNLDLYKIKIHIKFQFICQEILILITTVI